VAQAPRLRANSCNPSQGRRSTPARVIIAEKAENQVVAAGSHRPKNLE
jgi:hypothetical protein